MNRLFFVILFSFITITWLVQAQGEVLLLEETSQILTDGLYGGIQKRDYLFFIEQGTTNTRLLVVDVSNPAYPEIAGALAGFYGFDMFLEGDYLYTAGGGAMWIIDVSDPTAPTLLHTYTDFEWQNGYWPFVQGVAVKDDHAYLTVSYGESYATYFGEIVVLDVSDPLSPIHVNTVEVGLGRYEDIFIRDNYAYYVWENLILAIDISAPDDPVRVSINAGANWFIRRVFVADDRLFIDAEEDGWWVYAFVPVEHGLLKAVVHHEEELWLAGYADGYLYAREIGGGGLQVLTGHNFDTVIPVSDKVVIDTSFTDGFTHLFETESGVPVGLSTVRMSAVSESVEISTGQTLVYSDTEGLVTTIEIGAGAVLSPTEVSYLPLNAVDQAPEGLFLPHAFDLAGHIPNDQLTLTEFAEPITVTLPYTTTDFPLGWQFMFWDGAEWVDGESTCSMVNGEWLTVNGERLSVVSDQRSATSNQLQFTICLPGKYALFSQPYELFFPVAFE